MQITRNTVFLLVLIVVAAYLCTDAHQKRGTGYTGGNPYTHILEPAGRGSHTHYATLDPQGLGTSTTDMGHAHRVHVGVETSQGVSPGPDAHVHDISAFIQAKA
jgi:hypothetical protein